MVPLKSIGNLGGKKATRYSISNIVWVFMFDLLEPADL